MARKRLPKGAVAVTPGGNLTMEHILGWGVVYSIPEKEKDAKGVTRPIGVPASKLVRAWAGRDLDADLVPKLGQRNGAHTFQRACRSVATRERNGHVTEVVVDEVDDNASECVYQITRRIKDRDERKVEFEGTFTVVFDKRDETIEFVHLNEDSAQELAYLEDRVRDYFATNQTRVPSQTVRNAVRDQLKRHGAAKIVGGVHFVPKSAKADAHLTAIAEVLDVLYGGAARFWPFPMADTKLEREQVAAHFEQVVQGSADALVGKCAKVLTRGASYVRKDVLRNVINEKRALDKQIQDYRDLLGEKLDNAQAASHIVDEQIDQLVALADELAAEDAA